MMNGWSSADSVTWSGASLKIAACSDRQPTSWLCATSSFSGRSARPCVSPAVKSVSGSVMTSCLRGGGLIRFRRTRDQYVMHHFGRFDPAALAAHPVYDGHGQGYRQAPLVDEKSGSVHTGLSIAELAAGGTLAPHVHSYEESFYVLSGEAVLRVNEQAYRVGPGDLGALKVGTVHAWRAAGAAPVRWLQMAAPQPKPPGGERDTFFLRNASVPGDAPRLDLSRLDGNLLGHFDVGQ